MNRLLILIAATLLSWQIAQAQTRTVTGKVVLANDNTPLPGASVLLKGGSTGVTTDGDGNYRLTIPAKGAVLVFSYISLVTQEISAGSRAIINVEMSENPTTLNEVVVTSYNSTQKKDILGSVTSISSAKFKDIPVVSFDQADRKSVV